MNRFIRSFILLFTSLVSICSLNAEEECFEMLTLEECIQLAKQNNANIKISGYRTEGAIAVKNELRSQFFPYVSLEGVIDNNNHSLSGDLTQFQNFKSTRAIGVSMNLGLFDFGASWKHLKASKIRIDVSTYQGNYTRYEIEERVKVAYYKVLEKEKYIEVIETSLNTLNQQLGKTKDLYKLGIAKHTDLLSVQVQLSEKEKRLLQAKNDLLSQRMSLNHLIGLHFLACPKLQPISTEEVCTFAFETALEYALCHRPDLISLRKQLEALQLDKQATSWSAAPKFYAFGNGNYSSERSTISAGIGMTMPLYEGGKRNAQVQKYNADIQELRTHIQDLCQYIAVEIKNTTLKFEEIFKSLQLDKDSLQLAEENLSNTIELYGKGILSVNDLLIAEEQLMFVKTNYYSNIYNYHINCAHFFTITGGYTLIGS